MFRFRKKQRLESKTESVSEILEVFCQACNKPLTNLGGDVSSSKRIYCHGYKEDGESRCLDYEMIMMMKGKIPSEIIIFNYHNAKEVQKDIKKSKLTQYKPLKELA